MATLNEIMEFDHVVFVDEYGHVHYTLTPERAGWSRGVSDRTPADKPNHEHPLNGDPMAGASGLDASETPVNADSRASGGWVSSQGRVGAVEARRSQISMIEARRVVEAALAGRYAPREDVRLAYAKLCTSKAQDAAYTINQLEQYMEQHE